MTVVEIKYDRLGRPYRRKGRAPQETPFDARRLIDIVGPCLSDADIAIRLGIDRSVVSRWRRGTRVMLGTYRADRMACRLGLHPSTIWGDLWWATSDE